jgi:hypothetical protein
MEKTIQQSSAHLRRNTGQIRNAGAVSRDIISESESGLTDLRKSCWQADIRHLTHPSLGV